MERLTSQDQRQLLKFIEELNVLRDKQSFVAHVVSSLSLLLPGDLCSYNEINPVDSTAWYTYAPSDYAVIKDGMAIMGRYASQNPIVQHMQSPLGHEPRRKSDLLSMRQLQRREIYHEFYKPMRIPYTLMAPLPNNATTFVGFAMNREAKDFSDRDLLVLTLLQPHLVQAFQNAQAVSRMNQEMAARDCALDHLNRGIVGVTAKRKIQWATQKGWQILQQYFHPRPRIDGRLPQTVVEWLRLNNALKREPARDPKPYCPLIIQQGERSLRICYVADDTGGLLLLEECCEGFPREVFLALGLTPREVEVLTWLVQGKTSMEIGLILGASFRTIQKHVERIFIKLGVESRAAAVAFAHEVRRATPGR